MGGWVGVVGLAENKATQPSLAWAWAELGKNGAEKWNLQMCSASVYNLIREKVI